MGIRRGCSLVVCALFLFFSWACSSGGSVREVDPRARAEYRQTAPIRVVETGVGYANSTVNTVVFRHHALVTRGSAQFFSYYDDQGYIAVGRRDLRDDSFEIHRIPGDYRIYDAHNCISLGIDPDGYLHISYDHHGDPLRYRRSLEPLSVSAWSDPMPMTGVLEDRVTYPYFIMSPSNSNDWEFQGGLHFLYRHGLSGNGDICLKSCDAGTRSWSDKALSFVKGTEQNPWPANAYWNHPAFDSQGRMHLSWVWRVNRGAPPGGIINNINMGYACTPDMGTTWLTSRGLSLPLPITPVNGETIWAISPGSNLINQCSSAIDSKDRLHIVAYADDPDGVPQYFHIWFDGRWWQFQFITRRTEPFGLAGGGAFGALQIPFSRPQIVIDRKDRVYVIYRGDLTKDRMVAQRLDPPDYQAPGTVVQLWDRDLVHAEPVLDFVRWKRDGVLSMLIQKNFQPNRKDAAEIAPEPVYLVDWEL